MAREGEAAVAIPVPVALLSRIMLLMAESCLPRRLWADEPVEPGPESPSGEANKPEPLLLSLGEDAEGDSVEGIIKTVSDAQLLKSRIKSRV
jgi:hypothetical protein